MSGLGLDLEPPVVSPRRRVPRWITGAGFTSVEIATAAGCNQSNSGEFRDGARIPTKPAAPLIRDAAALLKQEIQPVRYVIPHWLHEGLLILAAAPKVGKSTLILQIAVAKAAGMSFWGIDVPKGKVLIIDLETNERRLRRKLEQAGVATLEPGRLQYATEWPRGMVGVEQIASVLDADPEIGLVVIDTLARFRDAGNGRQNAYAADYEALAPLQQLCRDRPGLAIVVVHHRRKAVSDDPIDSLNGSAALAGAADGIWLLTRKGSDEYTLHVQARDWERDENEFRLEREDGKWRLVDGPRFTPNEAEVLKHLEIGGGMSSTQLGEAMHISRQSAHERLSRMKARGLVRYADGAWHVSTS